MRGPRTVFQASLLRVWDHSVVQVPDADGVHAIVLDGADPAEVARVAIALVLGIDLDDVAVEITVANPGLVGL